MAQRRIFFFDLTLFQYQPSTQRLVEVDDPLEVFKAVAKLPATYDRQPNRYLELADGNDLLMQVDLVDDDHVRGQFAFKRRTKLPPIETGGTYHPLHLEAEEGLAEIFHFVYYPETHIFGMEYNHFAPKIGRLHDYLTEKVGHLVKDVSWEPKLADDIRQTLQRVGRMTVMTIGVYRDQIDALEEWNGDLYRGFKILRGVDDSARELELVLRLGTKKKEEELSRSLFRRLPEFLSSLGNRQALSTLETRAFDARAGKTIPIDLLEDKLVAVREVVTLDEESKAIVSSSMYDAIEKAYVDLKPALVQS